MNSSQVKHEKPLSDIIKEVADYPDIWIMGERSWNYALAWGIAQEAEGRRLPLKQGDTGIFLIKDNWQEVKNLNACVKLYFFNQNIQYFCLKDVNSNPGEYYYLVTDKSQADEDYTDQLIKNIQDKSKQFAYGHKLGAIPVFLKDNNHPVQIKISKSTNRWRFYHA